MLSDGYLNTIELVGLCLPQRVLLFTTSTAQTPSSFKGQRGPRAACFSGFITQWTIAPGLSLRSNPGLKLANAFGVIFKLHHCHLVSHLVRVLVRQS
jgi:hypothetical protein